MPEARSLSRRGPYRWVRHPLYLGYGALWIIWATWAPGDIVPWLWAVAGFGLLEARARLEERRLLEGLQEYREYMSRTRRWLPLPTTRFESKEGTN